MLRGGGDFVHTQNITWRRRWRHFSQNSFTLCTRLWRRRTVVNPLKGRDDYWLHFAIQV